MISRENLKGFLEVVHVVNQCSVSWCVQLLADYNQQITKTGEIEML